MSKPITDISVSVVEGFSYRLTLAVQVEGASSKHPALVRFVFLDAEGAPLAIPQDGAGFLKSDIFGDYRYIGKPDKAGPVDVDLVFEVPAGCVRVTLELHRWRADRVRLSRAAKLEAADPADADAIADALIADKLMAVSMHEVTAAESYDVHFEFAGSTPLEERGILMAVRFFDAAGARLEAPANLPVSDQAGAFRYVTPGPEPMSGMASLAAPAGAVRMQVRVLRWKQGAQWALLRMRVLWLGSHDSVVACGSLDLPEGGKGDVALHARIGATGGTGTLLGALHLMFEDAAGAPVMAQGQNLSRSDRFINHIPLRPAPQHMIAADGSFCVARHFVPPPDAVRMGWRLLDPDRNWQLQMHGAPVFKPFTPAPQELSARLPDTACWHDPALTGTPGAAALASLPTGAFWEAVTLGQVHLCGLVVSQVSAGDWVALAADMEARPAYTWVFPVYFDAQMQLVPGSGVAGSAGSGSSGPGLTRSGTLPPVRDVPLGAPVAGQPDVYTCLQPPQGAVYGVFAVAASAEQASAPAMRMHAMRRVPPAAVCTQMDAGVLSVGQLRAAVQLAEATDQTVLLRDACRALSLLAPEAEAFAQRAAVLDTVLAPLTQGWLPLLERRETGARQERDTHCPLYLGAGVADVPGALVQRGQRPVWWRPAQGSTQVPAGSDTMRDGLHETDQDGVRIVQTYIGGFDRRQAGAAAAMTFDATYARRAAQACSAGLVHVCGGMEDMLVARAVAQAQDLPLVCELSRPLPLVGTQLEMLRHAQVIGCLCVADVVLAPAPLHDALRGHGVRAGALVDLATDPAQVPDSHIAAHRVAHANHLNRKRGI